MKIFKIIPTSILRELLITFLVMQVGFTLFFIIIGIFMQEFLSKMPIMRIPLLIPYVIPFAQSFGGQLVMVFTCVMIYSRIAQTNEILALRSSGISAWRVMAPAFTLAFFMSILSFWMTDLNHSWGKTGIQQTLLSSMEAIIYKQELKESCEIAENVFLTVNDIEGKTLKNVTVSYENHLFSAESAQISTGPANQIILQDEICYTTNGDIYPYDVTNTTPIVKVFVCNLEIHVDKGQITTNSNRTFIITFDDLNKLLNKKQMRPAGMSLSQLNSYIETCLQNIKSIKTEMVQRSVANIFNGNFEDFASEHWKNAYDSQIKYLESRIQRAKMEPTRRLAFAFNCFFLTWVCAPLSLKRGNIGALMLICVAILPLLFTYYPLYMLTLQLVKDTGCSPLVLWIPNLGMFLFGFVLVHKTL